MSTPPQVACPRCGRRQPKRSPDALYRCDKCQGMFDEDISEGGDYFFRSHEAHRETRRTPVASAAAESEVQVSEQAAPVTCPNCSTTFPAPEAERLSVITVRLPERLHELLKQEAHNKRTSLNKLCLEKLAK